jgi:hypothetical protein
MRCITAQGDMNDHEGVAAACKEADVVISSVGHHMDRTTWEPGSSRSWQP